MRRLIISLALALSPALALTGPVSAQTAPDQNASQDAAGQPQQPATTQTTIEGRALGEHVSGHAPQHPRDMGVQFGECVAELATMGECPHDDMARLDG